jgi:hypothetical protein
MKRGDEMDKVLHLVTGMTVGKNFTFHLIMTNLKILKNMALIWHYPYLFCNNIDSKNLSIPL